MTGLRKCPNIAGTATDIRRSLALSYMNSVTAAREELQRASEAADGEVQRHLNSLDEGLMELTESDKTAETEADPERVAELEEKLAGLAAETDDEEIVSHIENALDCLDASEDGFGNS